jgi:hypothetical protein
MHGLTSHDREQHDQIVFLCPNFDYDSLHEKNL